MQSKRADKKVKLVPAILRRHILDMAYFGESGHIGCAMSLVEILNSIYSDFFNYDPSNPNAPHADKLIMSKGHGVMAQYACMREIGWIKKQDIETYLSNGTRLRGLAEKGTPGIEVSGGSLGHGLSIAVGMALASKLLKEEKRIYCIVGDGEMNEGAIWEAIMFAAHHKLNNLVLIVDKNNLQAMGKTIDVLNMSSIEDKLSNFGFKSLACDGHDLKSIKKSLETLFLEKEAPLALVAKTVKGKGVSFMENNNIWHYTRLTAESYEAALKEVSA